MADPESKSDALCEHVEDSGPVSALKLDPHGFPLRPQPSNDPLDPLNWNRWLKLWVLFQVSFLAFLGPFTQALINPSFHPLAEAMDITIVAASYASTTSILTSGIIPILWSPLSNIYGRRPIFIWVNALGIIAHCASGAAKTWPGILVARAFVGIGTSAGVSIGAAVVADMYFMHERGRYMGIYIVFLQNGAHIATMIGGFIAKGAGWRYDFWVGAMALAAIFVVNLLSLPETLYQHQTGSASIENSQPGNDKDTSPSSSSADRAKSWKSLLTIVPHRLTPRRLKPKDFTHVLLMLKYPSVLFPTIYYSFSFGYASVLFAITGAAAFGSIYHFNTNTIGLAAGGATTVGTIIGEVLAGPVSDRLLYLQRKKLVEKAERNGNGGDVEAIPEARLQAMWVGAFLMPAGIVIEGVTLQFRTHWMGPILGIGIGAFGLQVVSTNIFAYTVDCYKPQATDISVLLSLGRSVFAFTIGFYAVPFAEETSWGIAWGVFAIINTVGFVGIMSLMWRGKQWRERLGAPNWNKGI